jgi:hypothetical protein
MIGAGLVAEESHRAARSYKGGRPSTAAEEGRLSAYAEALRTGHREAAETALSADLAGLMQRYADRRLSSTYAKELLVTVDRARARFVRGTSCFLARPAPRRVGLALSGTWRRACPTSPPGASRFSIFPHPSDRPELPQRPQQPGRRRSGRPWQPMGRRLSRGWAQVDPSPTGYPGGFSPPGHACRRARPGDRAGPGLPDVAGPPPCAEHPDWYRWRPDQGYELNNRPAWVMIPVRSILQLLRD